MYCAKQLSVQCIPVEKNQIHLLASNVFQSASVLLCYCQRQINQSSSEEIPSHPSHLKVHAKFYSNLRLAFTAKSEQEAGHKGCVLSVQHLVTCK